jgi:hypothetical protein
MPRLTAPPINAICKDSANELSCGYYLAKKNIPPAFGFPLLERGLRLGKPCFWKGAKTKKAPFPKGGGFERSEKTGE